jgi:hypothetical protein
LTSVYSLEQIKDRFDIATARSAVEDALQRHGDGTVTIPPSDALLFATPPGEAHVN